MRGLPVGLPLAPLDADHHLFDSDVQALQVVDTRRSALRIGAL